MCQLLFYSKISELLKNNIKYSRSVLITSSADELDIISSYIQQHDSNIEVLVPSQMKISNGKLINIKFNCNRLGT